MSGGSDGITAGPLFDIVDDDLMWIEAAEQGSRISMEHFDVAPRMTEPAQYRIDRQGVRICG